MKNNTVRLAALAIALSAAMTACNQDSASQAPASDSAPASAATAEQATPLPAKTDPVAPAELEAGLSAMTPRITSKVSAYSEIAPTNGRLFMHPLLDKDSQIELDVSGLTSVTLSPYIQDLSSNPDCYNNEAAGTVKMTWTLDGGEPNVVNVDRKYEDLIKIDLAGNQKLKVAVNNGNGDITCDWFSLGFLNVKGN